MTIAKNGQNGQATTKGWLGLFSLVSAVAGALGGLINARPRNRRWYQLIRKSPVTPPPRVFAVVWPVLYALGAWSASRVSRSPPSGARTAALALWATQLAANSLWTPTFFGAHRPRLAAAVLAGNAVSLGAYALVARRISGPAAAAVLPNLLWLGFAGVLNSAVISRNSFGPTRLLTSG